MTKQCKEYKIILTKLNYFNMPDKHPTEVIQNLYFEIHTLDNLIMQQANILEINKSKLENLKLRKQALLNYLNEND